MGNQRIVSLLQPFSLFLSFDPLSVFIFTVMTVGFFLWKLSTTIEIHPESDGCQWAVIANKKIEWCHACQRIYGTFSILNIYVMRCHQKILHKLTMKWKSNWHLMFDAVASIPVKSNFSSVQFYDNFVFMHLCVEF